MSGKKGSKKQAVSEEKVEQNLPQQEAPAVPEATDKKKKKEKKPKVEETVAAEEQIQPMEEVTEAAEGKKKKKKEKKAQDASIEVAALIEASPVEMAPKEKKKGKKRSAEDASASSTPATEEPAAASEKKSKKQKTDESFAPAPKVTLTSTEIEAFRRENFISVEGAENPAPYRSFDETGFPDYIMAGIRAQKFEKPTAIQAQGWSASLTGRDVVCLAETGSGKTLTFLVPGLIRLKSQPRRGKSPTILVLTPTRELAQQIHDVLEKQKSPEVRHSVIYGGVPKYPQVAELKQGVDIVIATPGRLIDHLSDGTLTLDNVSYLVLDEADRMLDMGFEPQMKQILPYLTFPNRQTLLFSATFPAEVKKIAEQFTRGDDVSIRVTIGSAKLSGCSNITQSVEVVRDQRDTKRKLIDLLRKWGPQGKILVFALYKKSCEALSQDLIRQGFSAVSLHADKSQSARLQALEDFKQGRANILVATDVAARGIDIKDIKFVINYEFPLVVEDYVHRIGRTGRAGSKGAAHTFFSVENKGFAFDLVEILKQTDQPIDSELQHLANTSNRTVRKTTTHKMYGGNFSVDERLPNKGTKITFGDE